MRALLSALLVATATLPPATLAAAGPRRSSPSPARLAREPTAAACPEPSAPSGPVVFFMIGEREYETARTLPAFARAELAPREIPFRVVEAAEDDPNSFPGIEALRSGDVLFLSVRRRALPRTQLAVVRRHLREGGPLVGVRTASHAFDREPPDAEHERWAEFDRDILGLDYDGHYGKLPLDSPGVRVRPAPSAVRHPVLDGLTEADFRVRSHLYRIRTPESGAPGVTILLKGTFAERKVTEPVAWARERGRQRVFYTSLGAPSDLELPPVRRLLLNAVRWCLAPRKSPPSSRPR